MPDLDYDTLTDHPSSEDQIVVSPIRREEEAYLARVCERIPERLREISEQTSFTRLHAPPTSPLGDTLTKGYRDEVAALNDAAHRAPYFGRIDVAFCSEGPDMLAESVETYYFGRTTIPGGAADTPPNDAGALVVDHRNPLGALFRRYAGCKQTHYQANGNRIDAVVYGKRQYTIERPRLLAVYDGENRRLDIPTVSQPSTKMDGVADIGQPVGQPPSAGYDSNNFPSVFDGIQPFTYSQDPRLAELLRGRHAKRQMSDIVEFIQAEQDEVIRNPARILIVQGPAGSGKTICALHRAAQLLYDRRIEQEDRGRPLLRGDNMLLLSPSPLFSDYVARVLPELNEDEITQQVFETFLRNQLRRRMQRIANSARAILRDDSTGSDGKDNTIELNDFDGVVGIETEESGSTDRSAGYRIESRQERMEYLAGKSISGNREAGAAMKASLDLLPHLESFVRVVANDLSSSFPAEDIRLPRRDSTYQSPDAENPGDFFSRSRLLEIMQLEMERGHPPIEAWNRVLRRVEEQGGEFARARTTTAAEADTLNLRIAAWKREASRSAAVVVSSLLELYRRFWREAPFDATVVLETAEALEKGRIRNEDMVPMLLLDGLIWGFPPSLLSWVQHLIIDEAQDYSPLHFELLHNLLPASCGWTVTGDIYQGIDPALSLRAWSDLAPIFGATVASRPAALTCSYRSTKQITDFACAVLGEPGFRIDNVRDGGRRPRLIRLPAGTRQPAIGVKIAEEVLRLRQQGNTSVAVLCRSRQEAARVTASLRRHISVHLLDGKERRSVEQGEPDAMIVTLPLAKGLEFDAVVLPNAGTSTYGRPEDRRALYTACTRPLHDLSLVCLDGALSPWLVAEDPGDAVSQLWDEVGDTIPAGLENKNAMKTDEADEVKEAIDAKAAAGEYEQQTSSDPEPLPLLLTLPVESQRKIATRTTGAWQRLPAKAAKSLHRHIQLVPPHDNSEALLCLLQGRHAQLSGIHPFAAAVAVTSLWRFAAPEGLEARVRAFLAKARVPLAEKGKHSPGNSPYAVAQLHEWSTLISPTATPESAQHQQTALMCAALTAGQGTVEGTEAMESEVADETLGMPEPESVVLFGESALYAHLLAPWQALAIDDPVWDGLSEFQVALRELAAQNRVERERREAIAEAEQRVICEAADRLRTALGALRQRLLGSDIAVLVPVAATLDADSLAATSLEAACEAAARTEALCATLANSEEVQSQFGVASFVDRGPLLARLTELHDLQLSQVESLRKYLQIDQNIS